MGIRRHLADIANAALNPFGCEMVRRTDKNRPWDNIFSEWIAEARSVGEDPNDLGDLAWADDPLNQALDKHYLPHIMPSSVVLELGPGSGRVTRHIISRCAEVILVDYSEMVCDWLNEYLKGKGKYTIHRIDKPSLSAVASQSVDMILANGVFEHIDMDDLMFFLEEFHRVLKPEGVAAFNFDNIMTEDGVQWFRRFRGHPGSKCLFRFYHPEAVRQLAESVGFVTLRLSTTPTRFAYIELRKALA